MSKIPCNIIRDFLVLYEDNVCSEESRQMIDEHIVRCEECKTLYEKAEKTARDFPKIILDVEDDEIERFITSIKKTNRKNISRNAIIAVIIIFFTAIVEKVRGHIYFGNPPKSFR